MTTMASSASVQFGPGQVTGVDSCLYPIGSTTISCHSYDDRPPILAITDAHVKVTVSVPDPDRVTEQDLTCARRLAEAAARYVTELEKCTATDGESMADPGAGSSAEAAGKAACPQ
jgi:hypothetical protein